MGAKQARRVWLSGPSDSVVILLDSIDATEPGKRLAEARLRTLHPLPEGKNHHSTDFEKRLRKIFEKQFADRHHLWLNLEFWQQEIDNVLIQAIFGRSASKSSCGGSCPFCLARTISILAVRPSEGSRARRLPQWIQDEFWIAEVDPILRVGVERAHRFRCGAVDAVLKAHPLLHLAQFGCDCEISGIGEIALPTYYRGRRRADRPR